MRKVRLLTVGNIKEKFYKDAMAEYSKRLSKFCEFTVVELPEFPVAGGMEKEAEFIIKNSEGCVILFDRLGKEPTSEEFANLIAKSYLLGQSTVTFIIGGSDGVSESVKKSAHHIISFGRVTFPHRLMRVIAAEQIYRAFTILENMPYHK